MVLHKMVYISRCTLVNLHLGVNGSRPLVQGHRRLSAFANKTGPTHVGFICNAILRARFSSRICHLTSLQATTSYWSFTILGICLKNLAFKQLQFSSFMRYLFICILRRQLMCLCDLPPSPPTPSQQPPDVMPVTAMHADNFTRCIR